MRTRGFASLSARSGTRREEVRVALRDSVQRAPAMLSPARLTTASASCTCETHAPGEGGCHSTPCFGSRERTTTSSPRSRSRATSGVPMNPVPPETTIFIGEILPQKICPGYAPGHPMKERRQEMVSSSSLIDLTTRNRKSYASADAGAGDDTAGVASRVFSLQTGERDHRGVVGAVTLFRQTK